MTPVTETPDGTPPPTILPPTISDQGLLRVPVHIDPKSYSSKPSDYEAGAISNRIAASQPKLVTALELADLLVRGHSWTPGLFKGQSRTRENWNGTSVFVIDVDNTHNKKPIRNPIYLEEALERAATYGIPPTIALESFSSTRQDRFRLIWFIPSLITDLPVRNAILEALLVLFREGCAPGVTRAKGESACDEGAGRDLVRLFYGGKGTPRVNQDTFLHPVSLFQALTDYLYHRYESNASGHVKDFCAKDFGGGYRLAKSGKHPWVMPLYSGESVGGDAPEPRGGLPLLHPNEEERTPIVISIGSLTDSSESVEFCFLEEGSGPSSLKGVTGHSVIGTPTAKRKLLPDFNFERFRQNCPLFREFMDGSDAARRLERDEAFGLLCTLSAINGGEKKFREGLTRRADSNPRWDDHILWARDCVRYEPYCCTFCPHAETCLHSRWDSDQRGRPSQAAILRRGEVRTLQSAPVHSLPEGEERFRRFFEEARASEDEECVWVVKAPTAIGKTEQYLSLTDTTIATPYHTLKDETARRIGSNATVHPQRPLMGNYEDVIQRLFDIGAAKWAFWYIDEIADGKVPDPGLVPDATAEAAAVSYKAALAAFAEECGPWVTTHDSLLHRPLKRVTPVIIDEDIVSRLLATESVTFEELLRLKSLPGLAADEQSALSRVIDHVQQVGRQGVSGNFENCRFSRLSPSNSVVNGVPKNRKHFRSNILGLFECDWFYVRGGEGDHLTSKKDAEITIHYIKRHPLHPSKGTIILSATADQWVYERLFGDRLQWRDVGDVEMKGQLVQHAYRSFSRTRLAERSAKSGEANWREWLPKIVERSNKEDALVLTYVGYKDNIEACGGRVTELSHFGKTEGIDEYRGRNLFVVGTPHVDPVVYILMAEALGERVNYSKESLGMQETWIERNGLQFKLMTFRDNEALSRLQLWKIESELTQAVGRARLLREDAKVEVWSNFPLPRAKYVQEDALSEQEMPAVLPETAVESNKGEILDLRPIVQAQAVSKPDDEPSSDVDPNALCVSDETLVALFVDGGLEQAA